MRKQRTSNAAWRLLGFVAGFLNGLFGSGGGMAAVPMLRRLGVPQQQSHATSIAIIFPLTIASSLAYFGAGQLALGEAWVYLPGGLLGALAGAWLLPKLNRVWLHRVFGAVILFSALRLLSNQ